MDLSRRDRARQQPLSAPLRLLSRGCNTSDLSTPRKISSVFTLREHAHSASHQRLHQGHNCRHDILATSAVEGHYLQECRPAQEIVRVCNSELERAVVIIDG